MSFTECIERAIPTSTSLFSGTTKALTKAQEAGISAEAAFLYSLPTANIQVFDPYNSLFSVQ